MTPDTARQILALLGDGEELAWVSILESTGSSPRHIGAHMFVRSDGSIVDTVGGGALEAYAIRVALEALSAREARLESYTLTADDAAGLGMICGGSGLLLVHPISHITVEVTRLLEAIVDLLSHDQVGSLVTLFPSDRKPGWSPERCLVRGADTAAIGSSVCVGLEADFLTGSAGTVTVGETVFRVHSEAIGARGTAFVFGAGHCGRSLVPLLSRVGFRTVLIDDRAEYANPENFPEADAIIVPPSFEQAFSDLAIDERSYVVILTRGHLYDRTVLQQALRTRARYVGMIGSRRKVEQTFASLREEGVEETQLNRVRAPIGLSIGAETPEEIAVSIAAQLIHVRAGATS